MVGVKSGQRQLSLAYATGKPLVWGCPGCAWHPPGDVCCHCTRLLCFTGYGSFCHVTGEVVEVYIILADITGVIRNWRISIF